MKGNFCRPQEKLTEEKAVENGRAKFTFLETCAQEKNLFLLKIHEKKNKRMVILNRYYFTVSS